MGAAWQDTPGTAADEESAFEVYVVCKHGHRFTITITDGTIPVKVLCPECGSLFEIPEDALTVARAYLEAVRDVGEEAVLRVLKRLEEGRH